MQTISLPGLVMAFEMTFLKEQDLYLSLFDSPKLFHLFQNNMVGGPAIIFKRYAEADKTHIRENRDKMCQKIIGYDANALYLWALSRDMPVGLYAHWQYAGKKGSYFSLEGSWWMAHVGRFPA